MTRRGRKQPPPVPQSSCLAPSPTSILLLDRFTKRDLDEWQALSHWLDEYNGLLYYAFEPYRERYQNELKQSLTDVPATSVNLDGWARCVSYRYSLDPLSAAGSLTSLGGRFNMGQDVDKAKAKAKAKPWPALYVADCFQTAYREKFQLSADTQRSGLSPNELALARDGSFSCVVIEGNIERVFDLTEPSALTAFCAVLKKAVMPEQIRRLEKRLKIKHSERARLLKTPSNLLRAMLEENWRTLPVQYGLPAVSHIFAGLVRDAGFEAIKYPSTKGTGMCLAVFPDRIASVATSLRVVDPMPPEAYHAELNRDTADVLCGWDILSPRQRR